jgi:hypothetical protein
MEKTDCNIFRFTEKHSDNVIHFSKSGKTALIDSYFVDPEHGKSFVILLKSSFATMKKNGCNYYSQTVSREDWENYLKYNNEWKIIKQYEDIMTIACSIESAPECIVDGFIKQ